ncbi:hypothetical protein ABGB12_26480 [Actinocorallia sp. B10E7]|uniref:hypothetical protein n=1 Tax=Actinocorallia sp. B10E7 TaxID=3153558 RepID=UPI00325CC461
MALVRALHDERHPVDLYGLRVEDFPDGNEHASAGSLERGIGPLHKSGTFVRAGAGWLQGNPAEAKVDLRIEFHDSSPMADHEAWSDVLETPYLCRSGSVWQSMDDFPNESLALDGPGLYRVRVSASAGAWCLRFWRVSDTAEPPLRLVRSTPAVRARSSGWKAALPAPVWRVFCVARRVAENGRAVRPEQVLDGLRARPDFLEEKEAIAEVESALPLLVSVGLLSEKAGEFRIADEFPPLDPRLATTRALSGADDYLRYEALAADVFSLLAWSARESVSVADAADCLLVSAEDIRTAVANAGSVDAVAGFRMAPDDTIDLIAVPAAGAHPVGPPPRAGMLGSDGRLVVWRDGEPEIVAEYGEPCPGGFIDLWHEAPIRISRTPHGLILHDHGPGEEELNLLRPDSRLDEIGSVSEYGTPLFLLDERTIAAENGSDLYTFDLVDGTRASVPHDPAARHVKIVGVFDGCVYFHGCTPGPPTTWRWRPGREPEALPRDVEQVDPLSGATLALRPDGLVVIESGGDRYHASIDRGVRMAPGGRTLYLAHDDPPAITFFDLTDSRSLPRVLRLPAGAETSKMFWEDEDHLLIPAGSNWRIEGPTWAYRLTMPSGELERVSDCDTTGLPDECECCAGPQAPVFVRPLLLGEG